MPQGLRILVVEDEPETALAVQRFLEFRGHTVALAQDGQGAEKMANKASPEVLVCDWKLAGDDDGVDVARKVRARHQVPVVMVTAHRLSEARRRASESDVAISAFRRKPVSLTELANLVESLGAANQAH